MERFENTYTNASVILRPARVAIMFRGGEDWRGWARLAVSVAGKYWGGAGFILVPFGEDGAVAPKILDVVAAYDPDHVVAVRLTRREMERVAPGFYPLHAENGDLLIDEEDRRALLARDDYIDLPELDAEAAKARRLVADACTPFHSYYGTPGEDVPETLEHLNFEPGPSAGWIPPAARDLKDSVVLASSESWQSDAALSAAIRTGIIPFALETSLRGEREQPDDDQMIRLAFDSQRWARNAPSGLIQSMNVGDSLAEEKLRFWSDEPNGGLVSMRSNWSQEGGAIVLGDSAEDFALAYAFERLLGFGVWLSSEMLRNERLSPTLQMALSGAAAVVQGSAHRIVLTSYSINKRELTDTAAALRMDTLDTDPFSVASSGELAKVTRLPDGVEIAVPELRQGLRQLAVEEPFETSLSVPISIDQDGTAYMRAPLPTPMPVTLMRQKDEPARPYWYVGVNLSETSMPKGRGVPQDFILSDNGTYLISAVRSSRDGFAFHSQAGGFIPAGSPLSGQLLKPKLKVLGMQPWVQAMVRREGMETKPSLPGMHGQLLSRRLGGRQALISMVSGPFHPALLRFASSDRKKPAKRTDVVFPEGDGVTLGYEPYLRFEALSRALPGMGSQEIRGWVDQLAQAELLRRGLILNCSDCTRASFVGIDQIGQRFQCVKCSAVNELTAARWKNNGNEPPWFFDLHSSFQELMTTHGDVGLFAANRLQQGSWGYSDTSEIEFSEADTKTKLAEIDLIAHVNGQVVVLEAKSNGSLGTTAKEARSTAKKKIKIAKALRADKMILATTAPQMNGTAAEMLRQAAKDVGATNLEIEVMVGLGPRLLEQETTSNQSP